MTETERRTFLRNSGLAITAAAIGESLSSPARAQTTEGAAPKETVPDDATRRLARFIIASRFDDLPETVRHEAKRTLVNWIGCAIGGSPQDAVTDAIAALSPFMGAPQASLLGRSERTDVLHASLLNGISSHVLDFDDTHAENAIHPAAPVAPALLALAEYRPVNGRDFVNALVVGVETECRIGNAATTAHYDVGWHITGTAGVFGSAAASGKLLGLNEQQMTWALGLAPTQPAGLQEMTLPVVELASPAYLMAVRGNADPMLGYLTTSFREHPQLRRRSERHITSAMRTRLAALDAVPQERAMGTQATASLYAAYAKEGGDRRTIDALREEGAVKIDRLRARGYDVGYGCDADDAAPPIIRKRLDAIYAQARHALYAVPDAGALRAASPHHIRVRTASRDREEYLAHPRSGESIRDEDADRIVSLVASSGSRRPQVQIVISDGLNANALNENRRAVLPPLRRDLAAAGLHVGDVDVVIQNGRVRAGYHVGALVDADAVVHFIGERPGTGLDTLSAYLTYGRDPAGRPRWSRDLDHAATTAVCGIHREGKSPSEAVDEVTRLLRRICETRRSGVALGDS